MEAANRGAREAGGKTIGLNIRLPFEQGANPYITDGLHFEFHYFFMRKFWFAYLAKALVIFPGRLRHAATSCSRSSRWCRPTSCRRRSASSSTAASTGTRCSTSKPMAEWGAIAEKDLELLHYADTPADAFEHLRAHLIAHHLEPATEQEAAAPGIAKTRG